MVIDHDELDAMRALVDDADVQAPAPQTSAVRGATTNETTPHASPPPAELARIFRLRVPVIVQLARRMVSLARIRQLSNGSIIEFDRSVSLPLDLLIRNHTVAQGEAVKVGENFGLRITSVQTKAQRIQSLGQ